MCELIVLQLFFIGTCTHTHTLGLPVYGMLVLSVHSIVESHRPDVSSRRRGLLMNDVSHMT